jgi:hypothetical protein
MCLLAFIVQIIVKEELGDKFALLVPQLATPTHRVDGRRIGRPALCWSCLLM